MMRSLFSAVSGLKNHQTRMDVIANNIANVNTAGFKASRVVFQDIFSQTSRPGTAGQTVEDSGNVYPRAGGTNPQQIGLGVKMGTIDVMFGTSAFARSDNPTDMMINGDGFFIIDTNGVDPAIVNAAGNATNGSNGGFMYTRVGNFYIDNNQYFVTSDGAFVMGYALDPTYAANLATGANLKANSLTPPYSDPMKPQFTTTTSIWGGSGTADADADGDGVISTDEANETLHAINFEGYYGISVDQYGVVWGLDQITNEKLPIAQLAIMQVPNNAGMDKAGSSTYNYAPAAGERNVTTAGSYGTGTVMSGGLEMSNVDLSNEFSDMIITQRGFQANSRVITVSDTLLEELVNLKR
ncbi:MAG: flagellar hook-basal body complex protein [Oscillospiraceae bacterium]|jgi:flagellar hook protein FlgE|nr:flagellar hook-basal body complex protein [Oscillospiraceae bacterium]